MPDLRVTVDSDLHFDLKVMALDKKTTLAQLVVDLLTIASKKHHREKVKAAQ